MTLDGSVDEHEQFLRMAREFPVRTAIFTFGLPVFGLLQIVNGYLNEGNLLFVCGFALVAAAFSVILTRYQVAVYRRRGVTGRGTRNG
jgi:hypothetical protein